MAPKEFAERLVKKLIPLASTEGLKGETWNSMTYNAKSSALIVVTDILEELSNNSEFYGNYNYDFLKLVKQELQQNYFQVNL